MGNLGCKCTDEIRDEKKLERQLSQYTDEITEFNIESDSFDKWNIVNPSITHEVQLAIPTQKVCEIVSHDRIEKEGELTKYQISNKELFISRWCILDHSSFKYFKSQYSRLCREKPLLEIPVSSIQRCKSYYKDKKYILEIVYSKNVFFTSVSSTTTNYSISKNFNGQFFAKCGSKHMKSQSNASNVEETAFFIVSDRKEWKEWRRCLRAVLNSNFP